LALQQTLLVQILPEHWLLNEQDLGVDFEQTNPSCVAHTFPVQVVLGADTNPAQQDNTEVVFPVTPSPSP
jgi:hypothetical protein